MMSGARDRWDGPAGSLEKIRHCLIEDLLFGVWVPTRCHACTDHCHLLLSRCLSMHPKERMFDHVSGIAGCWPAAAKGIHAGTSSALFYRLVVRCASNYSVARGFRPDYWEASEKPITLGVPMASAHDVAAYILQKEGGMTTWKLQKLVYYAQAWHTTWVGSRLFPERIEAWANGPVVPELYREHRGEYSRDAWPRGNPENLTEAQRTMLDGVLRFYGPHDGQWLSDLTHAEPPWNDARAGLSPRDRGSREITPEALAAYSSTLSS
jgi:uncharacterized phage-associated protein